MINIKTLAVTKGDNPIVIGRAGSSVNNVATGINGVYLWGHWHDHTADIDGDLIGVGSIRGSGNITMDGDINATNGNFSGDVNAVNGNFTNSVNTPYVIAKRGDINNIFSDNITNSYDITTFSINAINGYIKSLGSESITVDNLTVTKAAHFFKLIIDEIKSTNGMFILSLGNTDLDHVGHIADTTYRCFYKATDGNKQIHQVFADNDQVVCQTFNAASGVSYNISNKWYWMKCIGTGSGNYVPFLSESVNGIMVDSFDADNDGMISTTEFEAIDDIGLAFATSEAEGSFNELAYMSGLESITASGFSGSRLTEITLPESVQVIGDGAFLNCEELLYINLPSVAVSYGNEVFKGCSQLTDVIMLRGTCGDGCFDGCTNLTYLQLPEGQTVITKDTFRGCDSIQTLIIPSSVATITVDAFDELLDLKRIYLKPATPPTVSGATSDYPFTLPSMFLEHIYVSDVSAYTGDSVWSALFEYFEDYEFGTIGTGQQLDVDDIAEGYHYFDLTTTDKDQYSNSVPEAGDSVAVLGNRTDTERQAAIIMSAYSSAWLDSGVTAPFICQYDGINDYNLSSHRVNVISKGKNEFYGQFTVIVNGQQVSLDDYIIDHAATPIIETDSDLVQVYTDKEGYITSLQDVKGLPLTIKVRIGNELVPISAWTANSYITYNGNEPYPLKED